MRWAILLGVAAGCGGGSSLDGLYSIDAWNENVGTCVDPGPSVINDRAETLFFIQNASALGDSFVNVYACVDQVECMATADDDEVHISPSFGTYSAGNDDDGWTAVTGSGVLDGAGGCTGTVTSRLLVVDGEIGVAIRIERIAVPSFPLTAGACTGDAAVAASIGLPCTEVETAHGFKTGDI